jgi:hypothetical protein
MMDLDRAVNWIEGVLHDVRPNPEDASFVLMNRGAKCCEIIDNGKGFDFHIEGRYYGIGGTIAALQHGWEVMEVHYTIGLEEFQSWLKSL